MLVVTRNPILLIDEDDVQAGHAASVGRVDPDQLYYLMSRGISQRNGTSCYTWFLRSVVRELPIEDVKRQLREVMNKGFLNNILKIKVCNRYRLSILV